MCSKVWFSCSAWEKLLEQQVSDRSHMAASDFSASQRAEEIEKTEVASRSALTVSQGFGPQMQINLASPNSQIGKRLSQTVQQVGCAFAFPADGSSVQIKRTSLL